MSERDKIFASIREALQDIEKVPRPEIDFPGIVADRRLEDTNLWGAFKQNFEAVRGYHFDAIPGLIQFIQDQKLTCGYCDPALRQEMGEPLSEHFDIQYNYSRELVDELSFCITRGSSVVAETGSIILKDRDTVNRLAAVAPWLHIAVVADADIHRSVRDAILNFDDDPNIVWVTGPSKTGDIEGILIEGVHGPGEQVCFQLAEPNGD